MKGQRVLPGVEFEFMITAFELQNTVHTLHVAVTVIDPKYYQHCENKEEDMMSTDHTWEEETRLNNVSYNTRKEERTLLLKLVLWTSVTERERERERVGFMLVTLAWAVLVSFVQ